MTPLRIPRDTPGFDPWRGKTPQPQGARQWAALIRRISAALRDWWREHRRT